MVDSVIDFDDDDIGSATNALIKVKELYPDDKILFANGGDRKKDNTPERQICDSMNIQMLWSIGGKEKPQSSSWLVKKFLENK